MNDIPSLLLTYNITHWVYMYGKVLYFFTMVNSYIIWLIYYISVPLQSVNYDTSQPEINLFFNFKFEQKFNQHGD
jgi:hypothetical protein